MDRENPKQFTKDPVETGPFKLGTDKAAPTEAPGFSDDPFTEAPQKKPTLLYILVAIVFIGLLAAYMDLSRKVNRSHSVGTNQIDSLEHRLLGLFDRLIQLEKQQSENITADQEARKTIQEQLDKVDKLTSTIDDKLQKKADSSDMKASIKELKKELTQAGEKTAQSAKRFNEINDRVVQIDTLKTGVETLQKKLDKIRNDLQGGINELSLQLDESSKTLIELKSKTAELATTKLSHADAKQMMKKRPLAEQPASKQVTDTLSLHQKRISNLNKQITELKKETDIYVKEILKIKKQIKSRRPAATGQGTQSGGLTNQTGSSSTTVDAGDLLQQNLNE